MRAILAGYRQTIKRVAPVHRLIYEVAEHGLIPLWERITAFRTHPEDPAWFRLTLLAGAHEPETVAVVRRLVRPEMAVLDIGAHVGYYTRLFARLVGPAGSVFAFEPHPTTFRVLRTNTSKLPNVCVVEAAVADRGGRRPLYEKGGDTSTATIVGNRVADAYGEPARITMEADVAGMRRGAYEVACIAIDDWARSVGVKAVDVVKLDAEGGELPALAGMRGLMRASPDALVIVELSPAVQRAAGLEPLDFLKELAAMFGSVQAIRREGRLQPLDAGLLAGLSQEDGSYLNLLCAGPR